jgi:hypothetical protein
MSFMDWMNLLTLAATSLRLTGLMCLGSLRYWRSDSSMNWMHQSPQLQPSAWNRLFDGAGHWPKPNLATIVVALARLFALGCGKGSMYCTCHSGPCRWANKNV